HCPDSSYATLFDLVDATRDTEIYEHYLAGRAIEHYIRRLEVAIYDPLGQIVQVRKHVGDLKAPFRDGQLVNTAFGCGTQTACEVAARDILHHKVEAAFRNIKKIIVDRRDRRMIER